MADCDDVLVVVVVVLVVGVFVFVGMTIDDVDKAVFVVVGVVSTFVVDVVLASQSLVLLSVAAVVGVLVLGLNLTVLACC